MLLQLGVSYYLYRVGDRRVEDERRLCPAALLDVKINGVETKVQGTFMEVEFGRRNKLAPSNVLRLRRPELEWVGK